MRMLVIEGMDGTGKTSVVDELEYQSSEWQHAARTHNFPTNLPTKEDKQDQLARSLFHLQDFRTHVHNMRGHKGPLVFDRAFMSTLVYQGFTEGVLKDPIRYESLFALGAEAFLGDSRLGKVVGGPRIEAVFALLYCPVSVANTRITQRQEGRPDEVEMMGKEERLGHLSLLKKRYEIVMADVESRLPVLYPQVKFSFKRINTMSLAPEEVAGGLLPDLETLRGSQMELL